MTSKRGDTRTLLIDAAAGLLDAGGPAAVTLREVGRIVGFSHNAPYKHFASKEELLAAVVAREFDQLAAAIDAAGENAPPTQAMRALAHAYVAWAQAHPARYKLAYGDWTIESAELGAAADNARSRLRALVEAAQHAGEFPKRDPERVAVLLLALVHGACDLALGGHLAVDGKGRAGPEQLAEDLIALLSQR